MRELDLFDKLEDPTLQLSTRTGRTASAFLMMCAAFLVTAQAVMLTIPRIYRDLLVDPALTPADEPVNISISVLLSMPCFFVHMDVMDSLGFQELDLNTTVTFRRVDRHGNVMKAARLSPRDRCRPCYGLLEEGQCCPSCEMLVALAKRQNRTIELEKWEQCGGAPLTKMKRSEKCLVKGKVTVNRARGGFHIAPGRNVNHMGRHVHQLSERIGAIDMSHKIERVRFGPKIPTVSQPLQNTAWNVPLGALSSSVYHLIATPVVYMKNGVVVDRGYEYQAMSVHRVLPLWVGQIPGVFFWYRFSPYSVMVHSDTKSPFLALAKTAAVLSGLYAILSLVEAVGNKEPPAEL